MGAWPGRAEPGPVDGVHDGAHGVLWTEHACPHPGSWSRPHGEEGIRGKEWLTQPRCACGAGRGGRGMDVRAQQ
jgi:hypothetical protein